MNTLKINVPEGFEIDKEKSTFEEIVFKPIKKELPKTWEDLGQIDGYYTTNQAVCISSGQLNTNLYNRNVFATEAQAKASIALAQLSQLREVYRQGWVPDWSNSSEEKFTITKLDKVIDINIGWRHHEFLSFQSEQVRDEFFRNFKVLIEEASPLLFE